jgi:UDP-N-acetylglucosamine 2-epimerase (non-hydrolysing)
MLGSHKRIRLLPTLGYVEFLSLLNDSAAVLTDSGGVQEQALVIGTPCVTLARYTKHPVTLVHGGNKLAGADPHLAVRYIREAINARAGYAPIPEGWDGHAASRIVDVLEAGLLDSPQRAQRAQSSS